MMLEFLNDYSHAVSLDLPQYAQRFPSSRDKADFLLFGNQVVCEVKDKRGADMPRQVERVWKKGTPAREHVARDVSRSIIKDLRDAARQIRDSRQVLGLPEACGLVILENHVPETLSSAVFVAAADSEMQAGVPEIDCVLCLDFVNTFSRSEDDVMRLAQLVCRRGERSERLAKLVDRPLLEDFTESSGIPLLRGHLVSRLHQTWVTDQHGKFVRYQAEVDFAEREPTRAKVATALRIASKLSWIIGIGWAAIVLMLRGCALR
jgi:hypothetical protein